MSQATTTRKAEATAALNELSRNAEVLALVEKLEGLQKFSEGEGWWDTATGRKTENALGYLKMALESAGHQF